MPEAVVVALWSCAVWTGCVFSAPAANEVVLEAKTSPAVRPRICNGRFVFIRVMSVLTV